MQPRSARIEDDNDKDLKLALQMSLEEATRAGLNTQTTPSRPQLTKPITQPSVVHGTDDADDEDLKAAIAASLKDMEEKKAVDSPSLQSISSSAPTNAQIIGSSYQYQVDSEKGM